MRGRGLCCLLVLAGYMCPAWGELQNVLVGGEIRILGDYYRNAYTDGDGLSLLWPSLNGADWLAGRPIGTFEGPGNGLGILSFFRWDDKGNDLGYVIQWTRLNALADFTGDVRAFIEFDSVDTWGEDFRSNYITGVDGRSASMDDVEVYQAWVEAEALWSTPLRLRVGRQELSFGSEWLVGNNDYATAPIWGLSFDGARLTWAAETFSVDAWAALLSEAGTAEEDGDVAFYGVYGSCSSVEDWVFDAYWLYLRDARSLNDTNFSWPVEWLEDVFSVDDYDPTTIHTVGLRVSGGWQGFDLEAEAAYQWGDADSTGFLFKPFLYGDDRAEYGAWACDLELGYTFDAPWQPRVHLGYAWFQGEDNRDISFWDWLSPFDRPEASISFNRLFSDSYYSDLLDGSEMSNVHAYRAGVTVQPTESIGLELVGRYLRADETFDAPAHVTLAGFHVPIAPSLSFWTQENDAELGWELALYGTYAYSEDLAFYLGWSRFLVGDGLSDGHFMAANGLAFFGGSDDDDADYFYAEMNLAFGQAGE